MFLPMRQFVDELAVAYLVAQGVELLIALGEHPGVEGDPEGDVVDRLGAQGLTDTVDVHGAPPLVRFIIFYVASYHTV